MNLFQSIFGGGESRGRYPEALVEAAIERAVDGTDPRIRLVPGYRKRLRGPAVHAIDQVVGLVGAIPAPVPAGRQDYAEDPRLAAVFSSAAAMLDLFARDAALTSFLATAEGTGADQVRVLLLAERAERNILGMDLVGDEVRRDVPQVAVSFVGHRLLDPRVGETEMRRDLQRRAFDHLLVLALGRIAEARIEREDLIRRRDLLRRKCTALQRGGWTFEPSQDAPTDPAALAGELTAIAAQLADLGADAGVLQAHLDLVADVLGGAEHQIWMEEVELWLDAMNLRRDAETPSTRHILLKELHNARGQNAVLLPLTITPRELPAREDFLSAAARYL